MYMNKEIEDKYEQYVKSILEKEYENVWLWKEIPEYILIDEYHNLSQNDLDKKENQLYKILHSEYKILFMSATPKYLDRKDIFGETVYKYDWNKAIQNGYINNFEIVLPGNGFNDFNINDFLKLFSLNDISGYDSSNIKKMYYVMRNILYNGNRKCIIYFTSIEKANINKKILEWMSMLFHVDVNLDVISCETNRKERETIFKRFESCDKISILLNIQILNEGIDIPSCDSIYITKPNDNIDNIIQRMSRCNRIYAGKKKSTVYLWCSEKKANRIIDYINDNTDGQMKSNIVKVNDIYVKKDTKQKEKIIFDILVQNNKKIARLSATSNNPVIEYIKKYSNIPNDFMKDFGILIDGEADDEFVIDFEKVLEWLDVRKNHLKTMLVANFEENSDYIILHSKIKHKTGASVKENIFLTTNCFKELCSVSRTDKTKELRKYMDSIEKMTKKYYELTINGYQKKLGLCDNFQNLQNNNEQ